MPQHFVRYYNNELKIKSTFRLVSLWLFIIVIDYEADWFSGIHSNKGMNVTNNNTGLSCNECNNPKITIFNYLEYSYGKLRGNRLKHYDRQKPSKQINILYPVIFQRSLVD